MARIFQTVLMANFFRQKATRRPQNIGLKAAAAKRPHFAHGCSTIWQQNIPITLQHNSKIYQYSTIWQQNIPILYNMTEKYTDTLQNYRKNIKSSLHMTVQYRETKIRNIVCQSLLWAATCIPTSWGYWWLSRVIIRKTTKLRVDDVRKSGLWVLSFVNN